MEKILNPGYRIKEYIGKMEIEMQKFKTYWFDTFEQASKSAMSIYVKKAPQFTDQEFDTFYVEVTKAMGNIRRKIETESTEVVFAIHNETVYSEEKGNLSEWDVVQSSLRN